MILSTALVLCLLQADGTAPAKANGKRKIEDYPELAQNNVFSPPRKGPPPKPGDATKPTPKADPPKPDPIVVTGFIFNAADGRYEAVIEDRKKKEARFCKAGDIVEGWTLVTVEQERMTAKAGDKEREFKVGDALVGDANGQTSTGEKAEAEVSEEKVDEAKRRRRERFGKKTAQEDDELDTGAEKKNKK